MLSISRLRSAQQSVEEVFRTTTASGRVGDFPVITALQWAVPTKSGVPFLILDTSRFLS
jgi:hypothetical protein